MVWSPLVKLPVTRSPEKQLQLAEPPDRCAEATDCPGSDSRNSIGIIGMVITAVMGVVIPLGVFAVATGIAKQPPYQPTVSGNVSIYPPQIDLVKLMAKAHEFDGRTVRIKGEVRCLRQGCVLTSSHVSINVQGNEKSGVLDEFIDGYLDQPPLQFEPDRTIRERRQSSYTVCECSFWHE